MPIYEYRCQTCGDVQHGSKPSDSRTCLMCGGTAKRVWGFSTPKMVHEAFSPATGQMLRSRAHGDRLLKEQADRQSERTNIEHRYATVDWSDTKTLGVTDEGLGSTYDRLVAAGKVEKGSSSAWPL